MNPARVDALVDLAYGVLIFVSIVLIVAIGTDIGLAFGFGVLVSYAVHVVWKMARFDPDWMTSTVEETVEEAVEKQVGDVDQQTEAVERAVEEAVGKQVWEVQEQVEAVEERVERRPREDEVEELIEETVEDDAQQEG